MLREPGIYKVDVGFADFRTLRIRTNDFQPNCLLVDSLTGQLHGLDTEGRLLPLDSSQLAWECPLITGLSAWRTGQCGDDGRVPVVVRALEIVWRKHPDFYRLLSEVHMMDNGAAELTVSGLEYRLCLWPERFAAGIDQFVDFITRYSPNLDSITTVDLRFDNMIVCTEVEVTDGD
jgi:hypothetical protein